jgi:hypothetical protein
VSRGSALAWSLASLGEILDHASVVASALEPVAMLNPDDDMVEVSIWNTGDTFYINDSDLWNWIKAYLDWDGRFTIDDYVDCDHANDEWYADQDELADFEADSSGYAAAIGSVDNFVCESQGNAQKICVDLFIAAKTAGPLNGDNRNSDPQAGYGASRMQVYFDFDGMTGSMHISNSSSNWVPFLHVVAPDTADSGAWMWATSDTTRVIQIKGYNGYCNYIPLSGTTDFICPAIDALVKFTKRNGQWVVADSANDVLRDRFPTMDIYHEDATQQFQPLYHSPETKWTELYTKHSTLETWRAKLGAGLPPGCYFE